MSLNFSGTLFQWLPPSPPGKFLSVRWQWLLPAKSTFITFGGTALHANGRCVHHHQVLPGLFQVFHHLIARIGTSCQGKQSPVWGARGYHHAAALFSGKGRHRTASCRFKADDHVCPAVWYQRRIYLLTDRTHDSPRFPPLWAMPMVSAPLASIPFSMAARAMRSGCQDSALTAHCTTIHFFVILYTSLSSIFPVLSVWSRTIFFVSWRLQEQIWLHRPHPVHRPLSMRTLSPSSTNAGQPIH